MNLGVQNVIRDIVCIQMGNAILARSKAVQNMGQMVFACDALNPSIKKTKDIVDLLVV